MAYSTDDEVLDDAAATLKTQRSNLPAWWAVVVTRVRTSAYQEIYGRLLNRGFTPAQIIAWDRGNEFERSIALFFAYSTPQGIGVFDKEAVSTFDRRKELHTVLVSNGGEWVTPGSTPGNVTGGSFKETADGIFNPDLNEIRW